MKRSLVVLLFVLVSVLPASALDCFVNFGLVTVSTGYNASATTVVLSSGEGAHLPAGCAFNAVWYDSTSYASALSDPNKEIVRVTNRSTDTLTIVRGQESTTGVAHNTAGHVYKMDATITAKTFAEIFLNSDAAKFNYYGGTNAGNLTATGTDNTAFGYAALHNLTTGTNNTAFGFDAGLGNADGANNSFFGVNACATNTSGFSLTCLGYNAGAANTNGASNVYIGTRAMETETTSSFNVAVGSFAGQIETGQADTYLGYKSGFVSTGGDRNTYVGNSAAFTSTTGDDNVVIGYNAGNGVTTGTANTIIGANITGLTTTLSNNVILANGSGTQVLDVDNAGQWRIGSGGTAGLGSGGLNVSIVGGSTGGNYTASSTATASTTFLGGLEFGTTGTAGGEKRGGGIYNVLSATSGTNITADWRFYTTNGGTIAERWRMPAAGGLVAGTAKILLQGTGTGASQLAVAQTTAPTCTSNCGTSPSVVGSDTFMLVTMGSSGSPASGFVVTFNGTWAAAPACTASMAKAGMVVGKLPLTVVTTTTTITVVTNGTAPSTTDVYAFTCGGVQ